jgi:energy-coupling factor transport system ATP-binding protein
MEDNILIKFDDVSFSYDDEDTNMTLAVEHISFTVKRGEFVVILGRNGSGKSTIAKLSNSIYVPAYGKVTVDGDDTAISENEMPIRKKVGVVFQNPDNQIVASIVEEDVAFGPENLGLPHDEIRTRVDEALKSVGMYDYRHHETHRLSGGQKQRVAIAGMIAMRPECIVLDEPTAMLDPQGRRDVMNTVKSLNEKYGMAVVFITHFMDEAVNADKIIIIDNGKVAAEGTSKEIFSKDKLLSDCGLDVPTPAVLYKKLREKNIKLDTLPLTVGEFTKAYLKQLNKA